MGDSRNGHTPLPWTIECTGDSFCIVNRDHDGDDWEVCEAYSKENAEFILRACSEHGELLDALRNMVGMFDTPVVRLKFDSEYHRLACESARAAIAKAEGQVN